MMIKLNTGSGEWSLFDQCRNVICNKTLVGIPVGTAISEFIRDTLGWEIDTIHVCHDLKPMYDSETYDRYGLGDSSKVLGFVVRWDSVDGSHMLFTDSNDIYLMSDEGETIERI